MPHNTCGCRYHANVIILLEALHQKVPGIPLYTKYVFFNLAVCNLESASCMHNECENCKNAKLMMSRVEKSDTMLSSIKWKQWEDGEDGYLALTTKQTLVEEAVEQLAGQLPRFSWHVFIKNKQSQSYEEHNQKSSSSDSTECVIQMDFSGNYSIVWQNEIQKAH